MNRSKRVLVLVTTVVLSGCTITQRANPISYRVGDKEVCIVVDPAVNQTFLPAYMAALEHRNFTPRLLDPGSPVTSCPLTSTYDARWSWDFVTYMAYAKIIVYRDGNQAGDALYNSPKAGWALTTRIYESTESKVATMVNQLFP